MLYIGVQMNHITKKKNHIPAFLASFRIVLAETDTLPLS